MNVTGTDGYICAEAVPFGPVTIHAITAAPEDYWRVTGPTRSVAEELYRANTEEHAYQRPLYRVVVRRKRV